MSLPHEQNYPTHDLELGAIVFALIIWRHYLYGEFEVFHRPQESKIPFFAKRINMRQRRWLEFLKNYDFSIKCHQGKANVVADALNRKSSGLVAKLMIRERQLIERIEDLDLEVQVENNRSFMSYLMVKPIHLQKIKELQ